MFCRLQENRFHSAKWSGESHAKLVGVMEIVDEID